MENKSTNTNRRQAGRLIGKTAIVTGGETAMGLLIAHAMVQEGAQVLLTSFDQREKAYRFDAEENNLLAPIIWAAGDIRSLAYCKTMVALANQIFGHLDVMIDNSNFEFQQLWPGSQIRQTLQDSVPSCNNVTENFYRSAIGNMPPGGVIIHIACQDPSHPISPYPSFSSPICAEQNLEKALDEHDLRLVTVPHEQVAGLYLLNQFPSMLTDKQVDQFFTLSQSLISILAEQ